MQETIDMNERAVDVFFYGLFMDPEVLAQSGVTPLRPRKAFVEGFDLCIGRRATLRPSAGARTYGMLFSLTPTELDRLYRVPGVEQYRPEAVLASPFDGAPIPALCYTLPNGPDPADHNADYALRLKRVLEKLGFPPAYVASIA